MFSAVAVLALAAVAHASPTPNTDGRYFSLAAIHNGVTPNGTIAMMKAYMKYGWQQSDHQDLSKAFLREISPSRKRQDTVVTASPTTEDIQYLIPVSVGGQKLNLDLDTGSSDL